MGSTEFLCLFSVAELPRTKQNPGAPGKRLLLERVEADASSAFLDPIDLQRSPVSGRAVGVWEGRWDGEGSTGSLGIKD